MNVVNPSHNYSCKVKKAPSVTWRVVCWTSPRESETDKSAKLERGLYLPLSGKQVDADSGSPL